MHVWVAWIRIWKWHYSLWILIIMTAYLPKCCIGKHYWARSVCPIRNECKVPHQQHTPLSMLDQAPVPILIWDLVTCVAILLAILNALKYLELNLQRLVQLFAYILKDLAFCDEGRTRWKRSMPWHGMVLSTCPKNAKNVHELLAHLRMQEKHKATK